MRIAHLVLYRSFRGHLADFILVAGVALLQGCAVNAPSCDGRLEPINTPAPLNAGGAEERSTSEQEDAA